MAGFTTVAALATVLAIVSFAGTAFADTIQYSGQGTTNGACDTFEQDSNVPAGQQAWQFNLTGTAGPATMSATFSDGTVVTNLAEDQPHTGNVSKWTILTDAGATVLSASATRPESGGNPQFVVSHCATSEPPPTTAPPTTAPSTTIPIEVGGITAERPPAAVAVISVPVFTG